MRQEIEIEKVGKVLQRSLVYLCVCVKAVMTVCAHTSSNIIYLFSLQLREYCERGGSQKEVHALRENRPRVSLPMIVNQLSQ